MHTFPDLAICPCCDRVHRRVALASGEQALCLRCSGLLYKPQPHYPRQLALMLSAFFALPVACLMPLIIVSLQGNAHPISLQNMVSLLVQSDQLLLGTIVLLMLVLFPAIQIGLFSWLACFACRGRRAPGSPVAIKILQTLLPWCMTDICLLALLIAGFKMVAFLQLTTGPGFWALIWVTYVSRTLTRHDLVSLWAIPATAHPSGADRGDKQAESSGPKLTRCQRCELVCRSDPASKLTARCPRCYSLLPVREGDNLSRVAILLFLSVCFYLPANLLPVMQTTLAGNSSENTIFTGIFAFWNSGSYGIASIIFIASVVIPCLKFLVMGLLIITCQRRSRWAKEKRTAFYKVTEMIGYLSLLDVIVVAIMSCAMQFSPFVTVEPRSGILFYALTVILTMCSALSFNPRLIWKRTDHD